MALLSILYALSEMSSNQCQKILKSNYQCTRHRSLASEFCWQHKSLVRKTAPIRSKTNDPNLPIRGYFPNREKWLQ